jgi:hypothetical protein
MKIFKLKTNDDVFKFESLEFTDDLQLSVDSKNRLVEYINTIFEEIEYNDDKDFISIISEGLKANDWDRIGNTIDIFTTDKNIYQMCYVEDSKESLNFLGTVTNNKRKIINGDAFIFANTLSTTQIEDNSKALDYIKKVSIDMNDIIEILLSNYYFKGLFFEGDVYGKFLFDNSLKVVSPTKYKDLDISTLSFKKADVLNFSTNIFYDNVGDKIKQKYNNKLSLYYLENLKDRIFFTIKSENEKKFDQILDSYINKIFTIFDKFCHDDDEMRIPKEFKFYDYQTNENYTNKYIVFDKLYDKIVLSKI